MSPQKITQHSLHFLFLFLHSLRNQTETTQKNLQIDQYPLMQTHQYQIPINQNWNLEAK